MPPSYGMKNLQFGKYSGPWLLSTGIGLVALHRDDSSMSLTGFIFSISPAAGTWGLGNVITKGIGKVNMIALVVWGSFVASIPMIYLSFLLDGLAGMSYSYHHLTWQGVASVLFIVYFSTWIGYGVWSWLLHKYTVATVVPFTLLVPIVGMLSSVVYLGEPLQSWKIWAGILVISGLGVNLLGAKYFTKKILQTAGN